MPRMPIRSGSGISRLLALVVMVVIGQALVTGGLAAPISSEDIISVQAVRQQPDALQLLATRLMVPAQARWETDPDAGPLTFTVETGVLSVQLGGGLARIERRSNPLT